MTTAEKLDFDRLTTFIDQGRLIRGAWTGTDEKGRETACLLASLYPDTGKSRSVEACPAALMRPWLAYLTVWIDDNGTLAKWPEHVRRYAAVIRGVVSLDAQADDRLSRKVRVAIVREAVSHVTVDKWGVRAACEGMISALEDGDKGKIVAAAAAAAAAADAARYAAAADVARYAAAAAARYAADDAAAAAAAAVAADRIIEATLAAMEVTVKENETP